MTGVKRLILVSSGMLSLAAGLVGILIPGWPTACLLLSSACFSSSWGRASRWMHTTRFLGPYLQGKCREDRPKGRGMRVAGLLTLWLGIGISLFLLVEVWWIPLVLLAISAAARWQLAWHEANACLHSFW